MLVFFRKRRACGLSPLEKREKVQGQACKTGLAEIQGQACKIGLSPLEREIKSPQPPFRKGGLLDCRL